MFETEIAFARAGEDSRVAISNEGRALHNLHIGIDAFDEQLCNEADIEPCSAPPRIRGGESATIDFNLPPGVYTFRCDFHPEEMTGTLIVMAQ
jgi:plastocyanin